MSNSVKNVSDALLELLKYLDTPIGDDPVTPLSKIQDYRRRLGDDCTLIQGYIYSLLTRKEIWEKLGVLWKALYDHSNVLREGGRDTNE